MRLAEFVSKDTGEEFGIWPDNAELWMVKGETRLITPGQDVEHTTVTCTLQEARDELNAARNWTLEGHCQRGSEMGHCGCATLPSFPVKKGRRK